MAVGLTEIKFSRERDLICCLAVGLVRRHETADHSLCSAPFLWVPIILGLIADSALAAQRLDRCQKPYLIFAPRKNDGTG